MGVDVSNDTNNEEIIIVESVYDVPSDNYDDYELEIDPDKLGRCLRQTNTLKGSSREIQFYGDSHLLMRHKESKNAEEKNFRLSLSWLSSEPVHNKVIVWRWLVLSLLFFSMIVAVIIFERSGLIDTQMSLIISIPCFSLASILLLIFLYTMRDEFIFHSLYGGASLFLLDNARPSQSEFDDFFIALQQSIDRSQADLTVSERLVGELKMCRRLKDEHIISEQAYTEARSAIFKHEQYMATSC